jgi:Excalibur calcium-binding domain
MVRMKTLPCVIAAACLVLTMGEAGAVPAHKCLRDGTVTYQQGPCPSDRARKDPSLEELNAAEKKRRQEKAAASATPPQKPAEPVAPAATPEAPDTPGPAPRWRCDGRQHCSQMSSCAEAKFFLANCPNTKMDGDHDGIPCEQQWCDGPIDQVSGRKRR